MPSLRVLDDRAIRDSEREMAHAFLQSPSATNRQSVGTNVNGVNTDIESSAVLARVKSVSNIAKRSAGKNFDGVS